MQLHRPTALRASLLFITLTASVAAGRAHYLQQAGRDTSPLQASESEYRELQQGLRLYQHLIAPHVKAQDLTIRSVTSAESIEFHDSTIIPPPEPSPMLMLVFSSKDLVEPDFFIQSTSLLVHPLRPDVPIGDFPEQPLSWHVLSVPIDSEENPAPEYRSLGISHPENAELKRYLSAGRFVYQSETPGFESISADAGDDKP